MADAAPKPPMNRLLAALPREEAERIRPLLDEVSIEFGEDLYATWEPTEHVWFPHSGVLSMLSELDEAKFVEIATIGPEGFAGIQVLLHGEKLASRCLAQVAGRGARMEAKALHRAVKENPRFERLLFRYVTALFTQVAQNAACNRMHGVEQRLARWLLMTQDRVHGSDFQLTQEFIAQMLGVRRPTVSVAAGMLMRRGFITYVRGRVTIVDREGLKGAACECYGVIRGEFERLVGSAG